MQEITSLFVEAATCFGLRLNTTKTELLYQPPPQQQQPEQPVVEVNGEALKTTSTFTYLGSTITSKNSSDAEINRRTQAACKAFGSFQQRLWSRHDIKLSTKIKVYNAAVLPSLLYSTETMVLYRKHIKQLTQVQLRHLRQIMKIKWQDRVPDVSVLERAEAVSVEALITSAQLRWAGHVSRMSEDRLPKQVLYSELLHGRRKRGRPILRYKDVLKRHMKCAEIDPNTWEQQAIVRPAWRSTLHQTVKKVEEKRTFDYLLAHERRHTILTTSDYSCDKCKQACRSRAGPAAHLRACNTKPN